MVWYAVVCYGMIGICDIGPTPHATCPSPPIPDSHTHTKARIRSGRGWHRTRTKRAVPTYPPTIAEKRREEGGGGGGKGLSSVKIKFRHCLPECYYYYYRKLAILFVRTSSNAGQTNDRLGPRYQANAMRMYSEQAHRAQGERMEPKSPTPGGATGCTGSVTTQAHTGPLAGPAYPQAKSRAGSVSRQQGRRAPKW